MNGFQAMLLTELAALALAAGRLAGFILVSPFPGKHVPNKAKVALIVLLAWLARSTTPPPDGLTFGYSLIGYAACEVAIGVVIGFTVRVTFSSAEVVGNAFAQATGLQSAQVYDPSLGAEDTVASRIVTLFGMLVFFGVGAHRVALGYLLASFQALPIGKDAMIVATTPSIVDFASQSLGAGVRLALPVTAVALAVQLALALVARASPQLQVFSVGLGLGVAAGFLAILGSIDDVGAGLATEYTHEGPRIEQVVREMAQPPPHPAPPKK